MKHTLKIYYISMWIITLVLSIILLSAFIASFILFALPILPVLDKLPNGPIYILIIVMCSLASIFLLFLLLKASIAFKNARNKNNDSLIEQRSNLFGYGIFVSIMIAPTIIGLIVMLVFTIFVNDYLVESKTMKDKKEKQMAELEKLEKNRLLN